MTDINGYCRDDAARWAECFVGAKNQNNWALGDIEEGLMIGWFANAIEAACDHRHASLIAENERMREALEELSCRHVTAKPLWWQVVARDALKETEE